MKFTDVSFKKKVYLLLLLPLIGFTWFSVQSMIKSTAVYQEMSQLNRLTELSVIYSALVHELQKERGMTAGYLGSKGDAFSAEIKKQRSNVDSKVSAMKQFIRENDFTNQSIKNLENTIGNDLNKLSQVRSQVTALDISLAKALGYYTGLNAKLLSISSLISSLSQDPEVTKNTVAYYNFLQGKERAGIERAVLSNTFTKNSFSDGIFVKFITLVTQQKTYFTSFNTFATDSSKAFYKAKMNHAAVNEVKRIRKIAQEKLSDFGVDALYWFGESTKRIGLLKEVENHLSSNVFELTQSKKQQALTLLMFNIVLIGVLVTLSLVIGFFTIRDLTSRVTELTDIMKKVRDDNDLSVQALSLIHI